MTRRWLLAGGILALLGGAAALFVHYLLYTPDGLRFVLRQLSRLETVKIQVVGATGTLAGPLSADRIVVDHEAVHVDVRGVRCELRARHLLTGTVRLDGLAVDHVDVTLKERQPPPESETHFLPPGLGIAAPSFAVRDLSLTLKDGSRFALQRAYGSLRMNRWRILACLFSSLVFFGFPAAVWESVRAAPRSAPGVIDPPSITLSAPATAFLGEDITFQVTFDNNDPEDEVGYGPFVELQIPVTGADG